MRLIICREYVKLIIFIEESVGRRYFSLPKKISAGKFIKFELGISEGSAARGCSAVKLNIPQKIHFQKMLSFKTASSNAFKMVNL